MQREDARESVSVLWSHFCFHLQMRYQLSYSKRCLSIDTCGEIQSLKGGNYHANARFPCVLSVLSVCYPQNGGKIPQDDTSTINHALMIISFWIFLKCQKTLFPSPEEVKNLSISQAHAEGWSTIASIASYLK